MAESSSVLDLLLEREHITIAGERYELRNRDEFSVFDFRRLMKVGKRIDELEAIDEPSDEQTAEYERQLDALVRMVLIAPETVHRELKSGHRTQVVSTFFVLSLRPSPDARAAQTTPATAAVPSLTAKPPRSSRASTARRRRTG
jgi:hypothetical protein